MTRPLFALLASVITATAISIGPAGLSAQAPQRADVARDMVWRSIGPANMAGRVTDIEAFEANPAIVLVAAASGGVFKSTNAGTTWEPIFDRYGSASIGDVAFFQKDLGRHGGTVRAQQRRLG